MNKICPLSRAVIIDQNHILLCKTLDLENNFYFLPGGHIEHGESAQEAVLRELMEEAGAVATIKRFLGILEHGFESGVNSRCHNHEYNFVFEAESESLKIHIPVPKREKHIELVWIPLDQIAQIDFRAKSFQTLIPKWLKNQNQNFFESVMTCQK